MLFNVACTFDCPRLPDQNSPQDRDNFPRPSESPESAQYYLPTDQPGDLHHKDIQTMMRFPRDESPYSFRDPSTLRQEFLSTQSEFRQRHRDLVLSRQRSETALASPTTRDVSPITRAQNSPVTESNTYIRLPPVLLRQNAFPIPTITTPQPLATSSSTNPRLPLPTLHDQAMALPASHYDHKAHLIHLAMKDIVYNNMTLSIVALKYNYTAEELSVAFAVFGTQCMDIINAEGVVSFLCLSVRGEGAD